MVLGGIVLQLEKTAPIATIPYGTKKSGKFRVQN
jgi:hypothetical protein